ncbi:50S ribosomal protein L29 [Candidatus Woesearchaeota archaeon]|nr:50S ribosomal protein L29 [Candidatus Woesearchaeota archaeon]
MAKLKYKELKNLTPDDLKNKLSELKKELMKDNAQIARGTTPKSAGKIRTAKKDIARISTVLREKELQEPKQLTK